MKTALGGMRSRRSGPGLLVLTYHRVGGGSPDERDLDVRDFLAQLEVLRDHDLVTLDEGLRRLEDDPRPSGVVLTFDDGFRDVYEHAWPALRDASAPFVLYLATAYLGGIMDWPGSTARSAGPGLTWPMVAEMVGSGLCTVGNHTHTHVPATALTASELDSCTEAIQHHLGVDPRHFAYPWGLVAPGMEAAVVTRFRSAVTGRVGRNHHGADPHRLDRVPVRRTDPLPFFRAKLSGRLGAERAYSTAVEVAKAVGLRG